MNICIIIRKLEIGGFSSSLIPLLKHLSNNKITIDVIMFLENNITLPSINNVNFTIHNSYSRIFEKMGKLIKQPSLISTIVKYHYYKHKKQTTDFRFYQLNCIYDCINYKNIDLSTYDAVISWEEIFPNYFNAINVKSKNKIGFIHPDYKKANFDKNADKIGYKNLNHIMAVSNATCNTLKQSLPFFADKIDYIYNTHDVEKILNLSNENIATFNKSNFDIITVARLDNNSKALDRLVNIVIRLKNDDFKFKWYIAGDGPFKLELETLIDKYNINDYLILLGSKTNPHPFTKNADLFVLQSYYEGKSMAVEEALILDTPVLISDYASCCEQVEDNITGFIAKNNEDDIYNKLKYILENKNILTNVKNNLTHMDKSKYEDISKLLNYIKSEGMPNGKNKI